MRKVKAAIIVTWAVLKAWLSPRKKKYAETEQNIEELPQYKNPALSVARLELERRGNLIKDELDKYAIPEEKTDRVIEYAIKLLCTNAKNTNMTERRIARKTAEYFKLKPKMHSV